MKKIFLLSIISLVFLSSCFVNQQNTETTNQTFNGTVGTIGKKGISVIYSHINDEKSKKYVSDSMKNAGIDEKSIEDFIKSVDLYNKAIGNQNLLKYGFNSAENSQNDSGKISELWKKNYPNFEGFNCRITSYTLLKNFIKIGKPDTTDTEYLFMDKLALKNSPIKLFSDQEIKDFESFFSAIKTPKTKDISVHLKSVKDDWKKKEITFLNKGNPKKASLISVFFHSNQAGEESYLFIGHIGILLPTADSKFMFIEKVSFEEPYQMLIFNNKSDLNEYLMGKYNTSWGQDEASPFIMENDKLMESYKDAK
ncbi:DUF4300 family protein [Candidatus Gracilibacteria bacterium]|nr:DUF4300 family protein [Candidatus Gracilibacteria bacterium]RKW22457.1 MAG: DUF4300 family protein [Candidatus Gracilibacteria bacterium]